MSCTNAVTMLLWLLVANRGEVAVRILRVAGELDLEPVALYTGDDTAP